MAARAGLLLACVALGAQAIDVRVTDAKNRPVTKVISILKDMMKQLEKESDEDQDVYEKMGCWCVTYDKEKTKSIAGAQSRITSLTSSIEALAADSASLNAEVANLQKELAHSTEALNQATVLRSKQLAEFNEEEKDSLTSVNSLKSAVVTLSNHHTAALLQSHLTTKEQIHFTTSVRNAMRKHKSLFAESITPKQRKALETFVSFTEQPVSLAEQPDDYLGAGPVGGVKTYNAQSGEIYGILKQMKEDFETSLDKSRKEEMRNVAAYEDLKAAKKAEIAASSDQVETKTGQAATADEKKAADAEDLEETRASLAADQKFLSDLQLRCQSMDSEFEERTKTRQMELQATSKALEFLSSDEAHDIFTRTFNPTLAQRVLRVASRRRALLSSMLMRAAKRANDPRLSALAIKARLDAFEQVKKSISDMIDKLLQEKSDDIKHKDYCIDEFNTNEVDTTNKYRKKDLIIASIADLQATIDSLDRAIETLKAEVLELEVNIKRASDNRDKANREFQATVAEQRATQQILTAALDALKGFYEKAALVQQRGRAAAATSKQPPPPGFKTYERSAASGGVMGMIQKVIDDAKALESDAVRSEAEGQSAYEAFVRDTTDSLDQKTKDLVSKSVQKARAEKDLVTAEAERDETLSELDQLAQVNADLHRSCDFLMKNFETRTTARDAEVEALKQGLALFSGASFAALLQRGA